ncbi:hypothetical protein F2P56_009682 [Juglans regia]|uniref:hAT-like transposase RNase-H fold domain-containing protein n=1 Tax=Juglans regia TaxID=51240 RepID=A0A833XXN8_JUGRE|nr:hypothetical protein F2P56_009682 [Juglans regia]
MAISMRMKFDKYWGSLDRLNLLLLIAVLLDPRSKLGLLTFHLKKIYDHNWAEDLLSRVRQLLSDMYEEYNATFGSSSSSREHVSPPSSAPPDDVEDNLESQLFYKWLQASTASGYTSTKTEIDRYLSNAC